MNITEVCIRRPILAWMIMAATVVFGGVAATRIGVSQFPDVDLPTITVEATWEGAAPEVIENDVIEILEDALVQTEGVTAITSSARQGSARVTLELLLERDVDLALQDVQAKVFGARRLLPPDMDPPTVSKSNPEDQPIMWLGLSGPYPRRVLSDFVRYRIKDQLQTVPGVGEIQLGGYLARNVRIWIDLDRLDEKRITVGDVTRALQAQHLELPAGRLETEGREVNVRVLGEAFDLDELRSMPIMDVGGAPVRLEDVALVEDGFEDERRRARVNGEPAQGIGIKKQRGSNAVAVAQGVRARVEEIAATLPEGMELGINFDGTKFVEEAVHEIQFELVLAIILTALACWLFLGSLSSTMNVVLAIPMSLLGTIAAIYFLGFTFNTFTLLALSLAVGIVVDDAIMVMENIYRHAEKLGKDRVTAAREGTREITFAAFAATLAVIAIFVPVVFLKGVIGKFFLQFGVTLCIAVALSYLEAVTLAPSRCAQVLDTSHHRRGPIGRTFERGLDMLTAVYRRVLGSALRHPLTVLAIAGVAVLACVGALKSIKREMVPSQDQSRLMLRLQTAVGNNLEETDLTFRKAEAIVNSRPEVTRAFVVVGGFGGAGVNTGIMFVTLVPPKQRKLGHLEFMQLLRKELNSIPGLKAVVQDLSQQGFTAQRGFPVEFSIRGPDWDTLVALQEKLTAGMEASGLVTDVDTDYQVGMPELQIVPDRERAADLGVSIEDIALAMNSLVGGERIGKYSAEGRRVDVRVRLKASQRSRPEDLSRLRVRAASGELIPLSALVVQEEHPALQAITRKDRERAISVFANVAPGAGQSEAIAKVKELSSDLPVGYHVKLGGASVAFQESMGSLVFALVLGIIVAYMVLASQFNSLLHPVSVLTILPPSLAGAVLALWLSGRTLNIFSMIGLLLLMGIVKKNSIILVDFAIQVREQAGSAVEAMMIAGPTRMRPILMTTAATMCAAVPAALQLGPGSETRAPMAIAVLGGLVVSTLVSLLVVPAFYVVSERVVTSAKRMLPRRKGAEPVPARPAEA